MTSKGIIESYEFTVSSGRRDCEVVSPDGWRSALETRGCLDGNSTNIYERPAHADEFVIGSLCQNPGSNPDKNAWSGIHTRFSADIIHRQQQVDGAIIRDMVCGTAGRPCPKLLESANRGSKLTGKRLPPPYIYVFPRSVPDPRTNPHPRRADMHALRFIQAIADTFDGKDSEIVTVEIESRMHDNYVQRRTRFIRAQEELAVSERAAIKRARY